MKEMCSCLIPPLAPTMDCTSSWPVPASLLPSRWVSPVWCLATQRPFLPLPPTALLDYAGASWPHNQLLHIPVWSRTVLHSIVESRVCSFRVLLDWFTLGTETKFFLLELKLSDSEVSPSWDYLRRIWTQTFHFNSL